MSDTAPPRLGDVARVLEAEVLTCSESLDRPVKGAIVSDLLSYVMAAAREGHVWITIQTHANIVAVGALGRVAGIVVAAGFVPDEDAVEHARDEGIPLLTSRETSFALAGRLYELGVR